MLFDTAMFSWKPITNDRATTTTYRLNPSFFVIRVLHDTQTSPFSRYFCWIFTLRRRLLSVKRTVQRTDTRNNRVFDEIFCDNRRRLPGLAKQTLNYFHSPIHAYTRKCLRKKKKRKENRRKSFFHTRNDMRFFRGTSKSDRFSRVSLLVKRLCYPADRQIHAGGSTRVANLNTFSSSFNVKLNFMRAPR